MSRTLVRL